MQDADQVDYFERRAEEERAAAANASDERAAQSHRALAARYEAKSKGGPVHEVGVDADDDGNVLPKEFRSLP